MCFYMEKTFHALSFSRKLPLKGQCPVVSNDGYKCGLNQTCGLEPVFLTVEIEPII